MSENQVFVRTSGPGQQLRLATVDECVETSAMWTLAFFMAIRRRFLPGLFLPAVSPSSGPWRTEASRKPTRSVER